MNACCVCLNGFLTLKRLRRKENRELSFFDKLKTNIPQIEWNPKDFICEPCINLLNIVHTFRETCLKSEKERKEREKGIKTENNFVKCERADAKDYLEDSDKSENSGFEEELKNDCNDESQSTTHEGDSKSEGGTLTRKRGNTFKFKCEVCPAAFSLSTLLVKHSVAEHGLDVKRVRPFACSRCNSRFGNSSNLLQHIKYHEAVRNNMCTFCGKGFITKTDLNIHEKQHLNKREYQCESCSKSFNTHKDLRTHKLVVHTDPQLWKHFCEVCNKRFPIKSNYDCHVRRHTGDKRFKCGLCEKKFTDKCVLQRHMRTHSNIREWKCSHCVKEYKDKRVLQIHLAKVHEVGVGEVKLPKKERKHSCHICPKAYYAKNKLTRHLYTHTGEKPFYCTICNKQFIDKSYVKQHMMKSHKIEKIEAKPEVLLM